jgi:hypothetical protein
MATDDDNLQRTPGRWLIFSQTGKRQAKYARRRSRRTTKQSAPRYFSHGRDFTTCV